MPTQPLHTLIQHLRRVAAPGDAAGMSDAELLERFLARRDEAAFELLVWRYGPLVLGVCRRLLRDAGDVEDSFQAAFLVLARHARAIARRASVGGWLHKVAYRVALAAQARAARRTSREQPLDGLPLPSPGPGPAEEAAGRELGQALDEHLSRLPEKYRTAFVLRCLAGKSSAEAARELGCPVGTVESRLARARARLRAALAPRHLALPASALALALSEETARALPATLAAATAHAATAFAAGGAAGAAMAPVRLAKGVLNAMFLARLKATAAVVLALVVASLGAGLMAQPAPGGPRPGQPELVRGKAEALRLPPEWLARVGVRAAVVKARPVAVPRVLHLLGVLTYDPDRLSSVRSRFLGEAIEIGKASKQPLRFGDRVQKGQLLAVVWSKDLGARKAALVDLLVNLRLDQKRLERLEKVWQEGAISEDTLRKARLTVQKGLAMAAAAEESLRIMKLTNSEIEEVKKEAAKTEPGKRPKGQEERWTRVEVRAPRAGTVIERNVAMGDMVDPSSNTALFIVADLSRLVVEARVSEKDLAALRPLPKDGRPWVIRPRADSGVSEEGRIEQLGPAVDPQTHTVVVRGSVENGAGRLLAGQFVTATVTLPAQPRDVVIPAAALVEDGGRTVVFVQPDPKEFRYELRRVLVVRRGQDVAHVRARPSAQEGHAGFHPLRPGERVITGGAVELRALLEDLQRQQRP